MRMSMEGYRRHLKRTVLTLAAILLVTTFVGLAAAIWIGLVGAAPDRLPLESPSLKAALSLALRSLRPVLPVIAALVAAPLVVAQLLDQLHDIGSPKEAHDFLNRLRFGPLGRRPRLLARQGQIASQDGIVAERVGGPASLIVYNDTAVVTEQGGRLNRILGPGVHTLDPHERIWELVDLRSQRWVREVSALTREGIPVRCELDICFKIAESPPTAHRLSQTAGRPTSLPYPYSPEAVLRAATSKRIRPPEELTLLLDWDSRVARLGESALRDILATYRLDWLIRAPQPDQPHPRDEIRRRLKADLQDRVSDLGARLLEIELGHIQVKAPDRGNRRTEQVSEKLLEIVSQQRIEAWNAGWSARALASRAEGEAELLRIDAARIQAQAEMVIALAEALHPVLARRETSEPYVLALRVVEALRWMSYDPGTRDFMPPEAIRTLRRLQDLLDSDAAAPGRDTRPDW
ncbi:MAG: SPFH domain-containing protein [Anaerolineae bacterium]